MAVDVEAQGNGQPPPDDGWLRDSAGRAYIPAQGRRGRINRQGEESVAEALARDGKPKDRKPKRKAAPRKPPPPKSSDLREIEQVLAEAFKSPAMLGAALGDEWTANHFVTWGPQLARNLARASEHNPWLRKKLEGAATSGDMMMQLMTFMGVAGSFGMYLIPPLVYWLNVPFPEQGRAMLGIPTRGEHAPPPPQTAPPPGPPPA